MEDEKGPSREDLGDSKQEGSDNNLEDAANQHADDLSEAVKWHKESTIELKNDLLGSSKTVEKLGDNIKILESMRIDCKVPEWSSYSEEPVTYNLDGSIRYDSRKKYLLEDLTELEKLRKVLIDRLEHRRVSFQERVNYANRALTLGEESPNAEWKPAPTEPAEEPTEK